MSFVVAALRCCSSLAVLLLTILVGIAVVIVVEDFLLSSLRGCLCLCVGAFAVVDGRLRRTEPRYHGSCWLRQLPPGARFMSLEKCVSGSDPNVAARKACD